MTVRGAGHRPVTFAVGELDAGFGNHPALLALTQNGHRIAHGPGLVVPGDRAPVRFVPRVSRRTVGIATTPATDTNPAAGSPVEVIDGRHHVTLSAALLARLPAETLHVSFLGPGGTQTHTEGRPVPAHGGWPRARIVADAQHLSGRLWASTTGGHGHPAEQLVGGRRCRLSLNAGRRRAGSARLVTDGDVRGRYVSGVVDIYGAPAPRTRRPG